MITSQLSEVGGQDHSLGSISTSIRNGIFVSRAKATPNGVPILRIGAVRPMALDLTDLRYSERDPTTLAADDALLMGGDLLFTRYNGNPRYVGACAAVPEGLGHLTYPDKLIRVKVAPELANPNFVVLSCSFGEGRRQIDARIKTTAGQSGISGRDLRQVVVRLPSLSQQTAVVSRIRERLGSAERLAIDIQTTARRTQSLRRSLLDAAFSGRFTVRANDMDLVEEMAGV